MKIYVCQCQGIHAEKKEMEDRATVDKNILATGYHVVNIEGNTIAAVMDGVGGLEGSSYASTLIADTLTDLAGAANIEDVKSALAEAHSYLVNETRTATTATGIFLNDDEAKMFHIGNCRLYGLFDGYLRQLSEDQTKYEDLLKQGITDEDSKSVINACLGGKEEFFQSMVFKDISKEWNMTTKVMITSDGIHDYLQEGELETFLNGEMNEETMMALCQQAIDQGSSDDRTVMVVIK